VMWTWVVRGQAEPESPERSRALELEHFPFFTGRQGSVDRPGLPRRRRERIVRTSS
jgi:hypothetical protein